MTTKATQVVKKTAQIVIPTGVIIAVVVAFLGKSIMAWPGKVDEQINKHEVRITKVETIQEDVEEDVDDTEKAIDRIEIKQEAIRKDMNDGFNDLKDLIRGTR